MGTAKKFGVLLVISALFLSQITVWAGGNDLIWLNSTQLTKEFCQTKLDSYRERYLQTIAAANTPEDFCEVNDAIEKIITLLKFNEMSVDQIEHWESLVNDVIPTAQETLEKKAIEEKGKSEAVPEASPETIPQVSVPTVTNEDTIEPLQIPPAKKALEIEQEKLPSIVGEPSKSSDAWTDFLANPNSDSLKMVLSAGSYADEKSLDDNLSKIRGIIRTNKTLQPFEKAALLGSCWSFQGHALEAFGCFDQAGKVFRKAQKQFEEAGEVGHAQVAEADGDRCYSAKVSSEISDSRSQTSEKEPVSKQPTTSNTVGTEQKEISDATGGQTTKTETSAPIGNTIIPLPGSLGMNVSIAANGNEVSVGVSVYGIPFGLAGEAKVSMGDLTPCENISPTSFLE